MWLTYLTDLTRVVCLSLERKAIEAGKKVEAVKAEVKATTLVDSVEATYPAHQIYPWIDIPLNS